MSTELEMEIYAAMSPDFPQPDMVRLSQAFGDGGLAELYVYEWNTQAVAVYLNPKQLRMLAEKASALAEELEADE